MRRHVCMTKDELLEVLDDIRARVIGGDSFEGSIEYLMPGPLALEDSDIDADADFAVMASYRIGNTAGQGGVRLISREVSG